MKRLKSFLLVLLFSLGLFLPFLGNLLSSSEFSVTSAYAQTEVHYGESLCTKSSDSFFNDELLCDQWHLGPYPGINWHGIKAYEDFHYYGDGIKIAVVDTGISWKIGDISEENFTPGYEILDGVGKPIPTPQKSKDADGHGTHIAGVVAQHTNNGFGASGIAFKAKLMPIRVARYSNEFSLGSVTSGVLKAIELGADIINLSIGEGERRNGITIEKKSVDEFQYSLQKAHEKGIVVVMSIGNTEQGKEYSNILSKVLESDYVVAVGATNKTGGIASYSSLDKGVDIYAPGGDGSVGCNSWIKNASSSGIIQLGFITAEDYSPVACTGTSQAAAQVSGTFAIVLSLYKNYFGGCLGEYDSQNNQCLQDPSVEVFRSFVTQPVASLKVSLEYAYKGGDSGYYEEGPSSYPDSQQSDYDLASAINGFLDEWKISAFRSSERSLPMLNVYAAEWAAYQYFDAQGYGMTESWYLDRLPISPKSSRLLENLISLPLLSILIPFLLIGVLGSAALYLFQKRQSKTTIAR